MPPRFVVPAAPRCPRCSKAVYSAEQVIGPNGAPWHKSCYTCRECNRRLDSTILAEHEGDAYCNNCHKARFGPTGYGYATGVLVRETPENEFKRSIGRPPTSTGSTTVAHNYTGESSSGRHSDVDNPRPGSTTTTADEDEDLNQRREPLVPVNATLKKRSSLDMIREQAEASRRAYDEAHAQRVAAKYGRVKADSTGGSTASSGTGAGVQQEHGGHHAGYVSAGSDTSSAFGSTIATTSSPVPSFSSMSSVASSQAPSSQATKTLFLNQTYKPSPQIQDPESTFVKSRQALSYQVGTPTSSSVPAATPPPSLPRRQPESISEREAPSSHGSDADTESSYMDYVPIRVVARKDDSARAKESVRQEEPEEPAREPVKEEPVRAAAPVAPTVDEDEWDAEPTAHKQETREVFPKPSSYRQQTAQRISPQPTVNRLISETDRLSLQEQEERRHQKETSTGSAAASAVEVDEWDEDPTPTVPSAPKSMNYQAPRHVSPAATRTWAPTASTSEGVEQPVKSNISTTYNGTTSAGGNYTSYGVQTSHTSDKPSGSASSVGQPDTTGTSTAAVSSVTPSSSTNSTPTTTLKTSYVRSGGLMTPKKLPMTFGGGDICPRCQKTVYAAESALAPGGLKFHKLCLRCFECSKSLDSTNITDRQGEILCKTCYSKKYGAKGYGYGGGASMLHTEL
ncbi:Cysteine and glycine-rich protein 1 [Podila epigama]|nr:Cysteine and glycine-rich protein 1 [Podila epigama]